MSATTRRDAARTARASTRARIIEATADELADRSFSELSVDTVMARVGLSRTAFYRYFDDLGDVIASLMSDVVADLLQTAERLATAETASDEERFRAGLNHIAGVFAERGRVIRGVAEATHHDEELEERWTAMRERFVAVTAAALAEPAARARTRVTDPEGTARALTLMNEAYLLDACRHPELDADAATEALWPVWRAVVFTSAD